MTMTDTEAKALALVNEVLLDRGFGTRSRIDRKGDRHDEALCRAIEREAATEARHAAELREQAERFSEAARSALAEALKAATCASQRGAIIGPILAPFILPAPDPLVELAREMTLLDGVVRTDSQKAAIREGRAGNTASDDFYDRLRTALASRQYEVRKIGEAGE